MKTFLPPWYISLLPVLAGTLLQLAGHTVHLNSGQQISTVKGRDFLERLRAISNFPLACALFFHLFLKARHSCDGVLLENCWLSSLSLLVSTELLFTFSSASSELPSSLNV